MLKFYRRWQIVLLILLVSSFIGWYLWQSSHRPLYQQVPIVDASASKPTKSETIDKLEKSFAQILAAHRKIIVLLSNENDLKSAELATANEVGQSLFHENQRLLHETSELIAQVLASRHQDRYAQLGMLVDYVESEPGMFDADRLAFRESLQTMMSMLAQDGSLPAIKLHKRLSEDIEALDEIEHNYEKEIRQIFGRFEKRGISLQREKWDGYVAHLKSIYDREDILKEYGVIVPYAPQASVSPESPPASKSKLKINGYELPAKTIALTFDDGPHPKYTQEIEAILKQYDIPAVFFNVGRNLGTLENGIPKISKLGEVSRRLMDHGFVIANHSYSHAQLSKISGANLQEEIFRTDTLLKAVNKEISPLFRFPYGAGNPEALKMLAEADLQSVMWNIDSLDWADPIPNSIVDRVLNTVKKEDRGIILFHDIHERTVKALPTILDRLLAEGFRFAGWDGSQFSVKNQSTSPDKTDRTQIVAGYENSWALVIGIDSYQKWPRLGYAASDAEAIRKMLIENYGFASDHVISLQNNDATRNAILSVFHDKLGHGNVRKNDRILVFFAGHGATRKLSSGRELGYIIPVDSDPSQFETDAIPMTDIQNVAESLQAKHIMFIMDACYSGLGLTRGGGSSNFLRDNAKRQARQMLTAGGADQEVADGGPNGHSIFTWTLLQGLQGKADLNSDGLITGTELAAYVAPAVAGISQQTPAFGSLPGSNGGEFVFELPAQQEYLDAESTQLSNEAIALNSKIDSALTEVALTAPQKTKDGNTTAIAQPVEVKDLQGKVQKLSTPPAVKMSSRQLAQLANDRGLKFYREKQYTQAEAEFTEALRLRPDFPLAANNLGFVYYKQEKYREAIRWFANTIKMDISRAIAYVNLGDAYKRTKDTEKAKEAYKTYLELAPTGAKIDYVKQQLEQLDQ